MTDAKRLEPTSGEREVAAALVDKRDEDFAAGVIAAYREAIQNEMREMLESQLLTRESAYALVERECKERGICRLNIGEHVCTAIRVSHDLREHAPMPTLMGAVDLLGFAAKGASK